MKGSGCRGKGLGVRVWGFEVRVQGFMVLGSGFRVKSAHVVGLLASHSITTCCISLGLMLDGYWLRVEG